MITKETIIDGLKEFFIEELYVDLEKHEISTEMRIGKDLGIDSLGFTEIMAYLEDTYSISIFQDEFVPENFRTINAILAYLEKKRGIESYESC